MTMEGGAAAPPVLVVGAGPVGLTMAAELARYGVPVRVVDRAPHATETSKALVVWSRTLELMDRMGCTGAFLDAGLRVEGATFRLGGRDLARTELTGIPSPYDFACMIPQRDTERLLTQHLARFGVAIERRVELVRFEPGEWSVACSLKHPDGREERLDTPWLIGCDGAHSTVRHGLGLAFEGYARDDDWLLADVRFEGAESPPADRIAIFLHADGPLVTFPMPGGRARVVATAGPSDPDRPRLEPTLAEVQALIDARAGGFKVVDPVWLSNFRINERKVSDYRRGRVFLAGDAAHVHSPAGGQGMNTGMQDAINLAWKLAMVAQGRAAVSLLDSYTPERSAVGDAVLRNAGRLTEMATLANPAAQLLRNAALQILLGFHPVQNRMAAAMSETDLAYPQSPLSVGRRGGMRLGPEAYAGPPPGFGREPRFVVFAEDVEAGRALSARHAALLETEPRVPPEPGSILVVRPDGYIGFAGTRGDWGGAEAYLERLSPS